MEETIFNLNNKVNSNNNNILLEIINDLNKLMNYSKDNLIIRALGNIIKKLIILLIKIKKI